MSHHIFSKNTSQQRPSKARKTLLLGVLAALSSLPLAALAFDLSDVAAIAQARSQAVWQAPSVVMPPELAALDYDALRDIRFNTDKALWRDQLLPIEINFFHIGRQGDSVRINEITADGVTPFAYKASDFNFGKNQLSTANWGELGFAGFRAHSFLNSTNYKDELIAFMGASYFRALGVGQRYGLSARGLAIDTVGGAREEFPRFTEFWLEKPLPGATSLTIYALLESERMTGAYRFDIQGGMDTAVDVHAQVFMRPGSPAVASFGVAPLTSMFFFGENQPRTGDFRPEVHDSDGLMMASGNGEWLWRPLQNTSSALVNSFSMEALKGFGLIQRDRDFKSYEDLEARYELRPSAWITPLGDWGSGRVELLQLPTPDETHDNIVAYWVPNKLPLPGEAVSMAWRINWQGKQQQRPPNSWVTQSRKGSGFSQLSAQVQKQITEFSIDFAGPALESLSPDAAVKAVVTSDANGRILESQALYNPAAGGWRIHLRVQRIDPTQPIELRAFLQHDNNTLSETWTNLITP
jgi:glucans biosynthesis protein